MKSHSLQIAWTRILPPAEVEKDPGFRRVILRQAKSGMVGLGLLGIVSVVLFLAIRSFSAEGFGWSYSSMPDGGVILWDKIVIIGLSTACLILSRTDFGPRNGRLFVAAFAVAASAALLFDDLRSGDLSFSPAYLSLVMIGAVGTMPYRPTQILALCLTILGVYLCFMAWHASVLGEGWWSVDPTRARFLLIVTPICTVIAALIYSSRYELYKSRRRADSLKAQVRSQSQELLRVEREKARALHASYRKLEEMQAQLLHQRKMASLGRLTAGVAHEMRNPLNFVVNYASLSSELTEEMLETIITNSDQRVGDVAAEMSSILMDLQQNAGKINTHGRRAAAIVERMLHHSHPSGLERRPVDLNGLVEENVRFAYHAMRAQMPGFDVIMEDDYVDTEISAEVAPQEIGRVVVNILENAFYAVHERAMNSGPDYRPVVSVTTSCTDDSAVIRIRDNGPGISEDLQAKVFEPFFTTKPAGSGTGLGLWLSYDIVTEAHGGSLRVESEVGRGTTFIISLPISKRVHPEIEGKVA